jgi:hypothetical protein
MPHQTRIDGVAIRSCLIISKLLIIIIHVDDILIYDKSDAEINDLIKKLICDKITLHHEGTAEGYLGVDIQQDGIQITLLQEGLTKQIIVTLGLDSKYTTPVNTPADVVALGQDVDGKELSGSINHASVVDMLLCLGHSWPDISFATHQCHNILTLQSKLMKMRLNKLGGI